MPITDVARKRTSAQNQPIVPATSKKAAHSATGSNTRPINAHFTTAIGLNAKNEDCFNRRGWAYFKLRKYDPALADFDEAVRLAPQWATPIKNRGIVFEALGNFESAFRDYDKAAALGSVDAMFSLGMLYEQGQGVSKSRSDAISWYQKAADKGHREAGRKLQALR